MELPRLPVAAQQERYLLMEVEIEYLIWIGDYRVRYEIDDSSQIIRLLQCKHRRDVYRK